MSTVMITAISEVLAGQKGLVEIDQPNMNFGITPKCSGDGSEEEPLLVDLYELLQIFSVA